MAASGWDRKPRELEGKVGEDVDERCSAGQESAEKCVHWGECEEYEWVSKSRLGKVQVDV